MRILKITFREQENMVDYFQGILGNMTPTWGGLSINKGSNLITESREHK